MFVNGISILKHVNDTYELFICHFYIESQLLIAIYLLLRLHTTAHLGTTLPNGIPEHCYLLPRIGGSTFRYCKLQTLYIVIQQAHNCLDICSLTKVEIMVMR